MRARKVPMPRLAATIACASVIAGFSPLAAQRTGSAPAVLAGATFQTWRFRDAATGIDAVTLLTAPFQAAVRLSDRIAVSLAGAWARGSLALADGGRSTIAGLTDTELAATLSAGHDLVTFTAIALLPTGQARLTAEEVEAAGVVAADVLPFRISNWGSGGGFGGSVAIAAPIGEFGAGLGLGYVTTRDFEPVETEPSFVYRPGNQLHLTAALDRSVGPTGKLSLRASLLSYDKDRVNDVNLYRAGNRLEATASYAFAAGPRSSAVIWAGGHHRAAASPENPAAGTQVSPASDILFAGAALRMPIATGVITPRIDVRGVGGRNGANSGYTAMVGVSAELPAGGLVLAPTLQVGLGSIEPATGTRSTAVGADIGFVVRFGSR